MTVGQPLECVLGVSALRGHFQMPHHLMNNIEEATEILKSYGFNEHGFEDLYCGMSEKLEVKSLLDHILYET